MAADLAFAFGWPPSELMELEAVELLSWHQQAQRFYERHER
ncbi:MAG: GpE family phage tail protein [Gammaproteobacteria bacterium]|nr:MAG: GpE family phage tail protein [Gammaproteobacteria bacterium]